MRRWIMTVLCSVVLCSWAAAQDAIMNSAETINHRNFKFAAHPTLLLQDPENELGLGLRAGYGFTPSFDMEAKLAFFDGLSHFGADAEFWLSRGRPDVSLSLGVHRTEFDGGASFIGLDGTLLASGHIGSRLELYGALDVAHELPDGENVTRVNIVPGIEYRLADDLDLLIEAGIGLNDDAYDYVSGGLAYYIR